MCQLGPTSRGKASVGTVGQVEANGCGGLSGAFVISVHQSDSAAIRCSQVAAGR